MKRLTLTIFVTVLLASSILAQGNWMTPISIKDFYLVVNAIRTEPKRFIQRVKDLFEDQRTLTVHKLLGVTYTDL
jgi:hypothetical protein